MSIWRCRVIDPELADFINVINDETLLASDPLFSQESLKVYVEKEEKSYLKKKMKSCTSNTTDKVQEEKDDVKKLSVQFVKKSMIWTTANSLTMSQLMREARCWEEKDYAIVATYQYQQSILSRLARKRESAKFVQ